MNNPTLSLILISRKLARIPARADLALLAARAGWRSYEGSWDSDNGSPVVAAFEADVVVTVLAGAIPEVCGDGPLDELFLRQGFHVVTVPVEYEPNEPADLVFWPRAAATFATGRAPLPRGSLVRLLTLNPTEVLSLFTPVP